MLRSLYASAFLFLISNRRWLILSTWISPPDKGRGSLGRTAMSEKALAYLEESMQHRMLVLAEGHAVSGFFAYLLRTLLSEGRIVYETVDASGETLAARSIQVEGPTGLVLATTAAEFEPEIENRVLTIRVDDSIEQTRAILGARARSAAGVLKKQRSDLSEWRDFQGALADGPSDVVVPFAERLALALPPKPVRLRRLFDLLLVLVKANAVLNRDEREDDDGKIVASLKDYATVRALVARPFAEAAEKEIPANVRNVVNGVAEIRSETSGRTVRNLDLARHLGIDPGTCSRVVRVAVQLGFLANDEGRAGQPSKLRLADPMAEPGESPLPEAERLRDCGE